MEIMALNPAKRKGKRRKRDASGKFVKGGSSMSKKRKGSSGKGKRRSRKRVYHVVRNPGGEELMFINPPESRARRYARRAGTAARGFLGSSGIAGAARSMIPMVLGALAAKVAQKRFGDKTSEDAAGGWTWKDYLVGAAGGLVASLGSRYLFKTNPQTSQKVLEGAFTILLFKLITQEIVPMSKTAKDWLGADDMLGEGEGTWGQETWSGADEGTWSGYGYGVGDLAETPDGMQYILGADGQWRPIDSSNRLIGAGEDVFGAMVEPSAMGDAVVPPGRFGEALSPPGPFGQDYMGQDYMGEDVFGATRGGPRAQFSRSRFPAGYVSKFTQARA